MNVREKLPSIDVNFSCQRCCQPLRLHPTLNTINKDNVLDLLSRNKSTNIITQNNPESSSSDKLHLIDDGKINFENDFTNDTASTSKNTNTCEVIYKKIHPFRATDKQNDCDYSLINDPNLSDIAINSKSIASTLLSEFDQLSSDKNKDLKLQIQLFDILSDQSDIDHPLCEECADFVIEQMDNQLAILEKECSDYNNYLLAIQSQETTSDDEIEELKTKLKSMQDKQKSMITELKDLNKKQKTLDDKLERYDVQLKNLKLEEEKYWHEYNSFQFSFYQCEQEEQTLKNKLRYAKDFYDKLKRTSIFNAAFCIWYDGHFGTINGFRLGRLPDVQVEWHEINAAWGQCALLLSSLAKKIGLRFQRFKIMPYGNYSFIESLEDKSKQLPLYTEGGLKFYFHQKFDQAMVAFLDCLQQFNEETKRDGTEFKLPYEMDYKGYIYDKKDPTKYSIKISVNTEEKWTKALKFMLTNLKWAITWVANQEQN